MALFVKQLTYHYLTALNGLLFLYPNQLACDWTSGSVPPVSSLLDVRNLLTVAAYTFLALAIRHIVNNCRDQPAVAMVSWMRTFAGQPKSEQTNSKTASTESQLRWHLFLLLLPLSMKYKYAFYTEWATLVNLRSNIV